MSEYKLTANEPDSIIFSYSILEDNRHTGTMRVKGIFSESDRKNGNNRIYPRKVWEKNLNDQAVRYCIEHRKMLGELEHPADGKTHPLKASHLITSLTMLPDGTIEGEYEVLNTPAGEVLKELHRKGVELGVSSRGDGSVKKENGIDIIQDDFKVKTWDVVLEPSVASALPKPLKESIESLYNESAQCSCDGDHEKCGCKCANKPQEAKETVKEEKQCSCKTKTLEHNEVNEVIENINKKTEEVNVNEKLRKINEDVNLIKSKKIADLNTRELLKVENECFESRIQLASIKKDNPELSTMCDELDKTLESVDKDIKKAFNESTVDISDVAKNNTEESVITKYETAVEIIENMRDLVKKANEDKESIENKYNESLKIIEGLKDIIVKTENTMTQNKALESKINKLESIIDAFRTKMKESKKDEKVESLEDYIAKKVKSFKESKQSTIETLLKGCTSKEGVDNMIESLKSLSIGAYPSDLPQLVDVKPDNVEECITPKQTKNANPQIRMVESILKRNPGMK